MDLRRLEALEQLGRLRDQKVLSEEEFEGEKARLLTFDEGSEVQSRRALFATNIQHLKSKRVLLPAALLTAVAIGAYFGLGSSLPAKSGKEPQADAAIAHATEGASQPASLSAILKFDRPDECALGDELKALFSDLRSLEPNGATKTVTAGLNGPTFSPNVLRAQQGNAVIARLITPGNLEGLRVAELRTTRFDGSEVQLFQIRFSETPDRVRSKLNETGFAIPKNDEVKTVELDDGHGLVYGVEQVPNGTALTCARL